MTADVARPAGRLVDGYCPMGCGQTLRLIQHRIACSSELCLRPYAVDQLVSEVETEHLVIIRGREFTVKHPLRERLDDQLLRCRIHAQIAGGDGPPVRPGVYRVVDHGGRLAWAAVSGDN